MSDSSATLRLIDQAAAGDRASFDFLFKRNLERVRRIIELRLEPRLRRRIDPSDVVQETQIEAFKRLTNYCEHRPMPFGLWLEKTALQRMVKLRRLHRRAQRRSIDREVYVPEQSSIALAQHLCRKSPNPVNETARRDLQERVRLALGRLPELDREILIMRYVEHRDNQEIAYVLDMKSDAISRRHGRAILKLGKLLRDGGIGESDL